MQLIDFSIIHAIVIFFNPPSYFIQDDESVPDRDEVSVLFSDANLIMLQLGYKGILLIILNKWLQDIKPRFKQLRLHGSIEEDDEEEVLFSG